MSRKENILTLDRNVLINLDSTNSEEFKYLTKTFVVKLSSKHVISKHVISMKHHVKIN